VDLTPSYVVEEDCAAFHAALKRTCDAHGASYADMKKTCDDYFYLPARREHRGVGGVFFDDLDAPWAGDFAVELMRGALADDGPYMPVAARRRGEAWSEAEKQWSVSVSFSTCVPVLFRVRLWLHIGSTYAAAATSSRPPASFAPRLCPSHHRAPSIRFNLLYDRGVKFGLSPESVERVLVSSPPLAAWGWRKEPAAGTPEAACLAVLREPRAWVSS
jgi:coproporphyrinogen III oxidase